MADNIPLREFITRFEAGEFENPSRSTQCDAGWYDWFCKDTSLRNKTRFLGKRVISLAKSKKINLDTMYVFFKNNCPMNGNLYDSFSICDLKTGDVKFWITPANGHAGDKLSYKKPCVTAYDGSGDDKVFSDWREVRNYFGV